MDKETLLKIIKKILTNPRAKKDLDIDKFLTKLSKDFNSHRGLYE